MTPNRACRCGTRVSAACRTRRSPTCSTAGNISWSLPAIRCSRSPYMSNRTVRAWLLLIVLIGGAPGAAAAQASRPAQPAQPAQPEPTLLLPIHDIVDVVGVTPVVGLSVDRDKIPFNVQSLNLEAEPR